MEEDIAAIPALQSDMQAAQVESLEMHSGMVELRKEFFGIGCAAHGAMPRRGGLSVALALPRLLPRPLDQLNFGSLMVSTCGRGWPRPS